MLGIVQFLTNGNQFLLKTYAPRAFEFLRVREHLWEFLLVAPYFFCSGLVIYAVARRRWTLLKKTADPTTQRLMEAGEKLTGFKQN